MVPWKRGLFYFWDEPEANMNPVHIPLIVEILLELQRSGVQIFVSTHDYILAKYFEVKKIEQDDIVFYSMYNSNNTVLCEKNSLFRELVNNPIVSAFNELLDEVYSKNLGE
jgi:predicted ATPase